MSISSSRKIVFSEDASIDTRSFRPWGSNLELWKSEDPEVVLSGPAGTGKFREDIPSRLEVRRV